MKMFSNCSGPCETCYTHYTGGCIAGHGDDHYMPATKKQLEGDKSYNVRVQGEALTVKRNEFIKETVIRCNKKLISCNCGCNVYQKHNNHDLYRCNSCGNIYEGVD